MNIVQVSTALFIVVVRSIPLCWVGCEAGCIPVGTGWSVQTSLFGASRGQELPIIEREQRVPIADALHVAKQATKNSVSRSLKICFYGFRCRTQKVDFWWFSRLQRNCKQVRNTKSVMTMRISDAVPFSFALSSCNFCPLLGLTNRLNAYVMADSYLGGARYKVKSRKRGIRK